MLVPTTARCSRIACDGAPAPIGADGQLPLIGFFVPMEKAIMKGNWDTMGLRGTGSFDYEIPEQLVDAGLDLNGLVASIRSAANRRKRPANVAVEVPSRTTSVL